jgi:Protein of unknown function (DUF2752)
MVREDLRRTTDDGQRTNLPLHWAKGLTIVPAQLIPEQSEQRPLEAIPVLNHWVRGTLLGLTAGLVVVFAVAAWVNPYDATGRALLMATHRQLGLPPCTFYVLTGGYPCPSCGMTTSFALLMHGDLWNSLRANAVGTALGLFCALLIPWSLICAIRGRTYFISSFERALTKVVLAFLTLMLARWGAVLLMIWAGWQG